MSPLKDKVTVENKTVKFEVEFNKSDLTNKLVWLKNCQEIDFLNEELKNNYELISDGQRFIFVIKKAQLEDEGQYTVKIKDTEVSSSANLSVTGNLIFLIIYISKY